MASTATAGNVWDCPADVVSRVGFAVDRLVTAPRTARQVAADLDPSTGALGLGFVTLEPSDPGAITASDVLAVRLLGVDVDVAATRRVLEPAAAKALRGLPEDVPLWAAKPAALDAALAGLELLRGLVGADAALALLARKRPHLVPYLDAPSAAVLELPVAVAASWAALRAVLADPERRERIDRLAGPVALEGGTTLRILDSAAWSTAGRGRSGRR